jgi:predicted Zn-dependent protease with MMP-like domain
VLASLPGDVGARLANVAVVVMDRPPREVVAEGFDPRAYGLFEGPTDAAEWDAPIGPTRVVLFVANLVADFGDDDDRIAEETRTTVLHEIGHYFGLDEDEVADLGLA